MRLWSIHPKYLDAKGLIALWREALLAQAVLSGKTKGYLNHPQLIRFKDQKDPVRVIGKYLSWVYAEGIKRGYGFQKTKIKNFSCAHHPIMKVPHGQTRYEFLRLAGKLKNRDSKKFYELKKVNRITLHPIFKSTSGGIAPWEKVNKE